MGAIDAAHRQTRPAVHRKGKGFLRTQRICTLSLNLQGSLARCARLIQRLRIRRVGGHVIELETRSCVLTKRRTTFLRIIDIDRDPIDIVDAIRRGGQGLQIDTLARGIGLISAVIRLDPIIRILAVIRPSVFFTEHPACRQNRGFDIFVLRS